MGLITESTVNDTVKVSNNQMDPTIKEQRSKAFLLKMIFEILHFLVMVVPLIIYSIVTNFLSQPKSVKDKVVLVS